MEVMIADCWTCSVLSLLSEHVFDTSWLYVPDGSSYHGFLVFHLLHGTDKPLWLDGHLLLADKLVFHI